MNKQCKTHHVLQLNGSQLHIRHWYFSKKLLQIRKFQRNKGHDVLMQKLSVKSEVSVKN